MKQIFTEAGKLLRYEWTANHLTTALIHSLEDGSSVFPHVTQLRVDSEPGLSEFTG